MVMVDPLTQWGHKRPHVVSTSIRGIPSRAYSTEYASSTLFRMDWCTDSNIEGEANPEVLLFPDGRSSHGDGIQLQQSQ